jgi:REP-associated tyrosine transposase
MARPHRKSFQENILNPARTFFTTTKTSMSRRLLQSQKNAELLIDVLRSLVAQRTFKLHDFVIMPDHLHILFTIDDGMTVEKAMQLVKGRFSYRLGKEYGFKGEVWQKGFSEVQVLGDASFNKHRAYIANNPVKAGLIDVPGKYPYCFESLAKKKAETQEARALES